jgi:NAD(P)-dependent dehydrogenase (short-subunit alcohol dehydrogenase family)
VEHLTESNLSIPPVAVVTGSSSGIGLAAALSLARRGWSVVVVGRNEERLKAALEQVQAAGPAPADAYRCDFDVLDDVRELAGQLRRAYPRIDVLANNAGGVSPGKSTVDGYSATMQTNYLALFLLTHELRERLRGGRIVNTSSTVQSSGRIDLTDPWTERPSWLNLRDYGAAKQAAMLFTTEAARRWPETVSVAFDPGVVRTRFGNEDPRFARFFAGMPGLRSPSLGAQTLVWLATTADPITSGALYKDRRPRRAGRRAVDPALARRLWTATLSAVGLTPEPQSPEPQSSEPQSPGPQ